MLSRLRILSFGTASARTRFVLVVGLLVILAVFIREMSGSAPRTAGSDHVAAPAFAAVVPGGGVLCQPVEALPTDVGSVELLIGTYGHAVPPLSLRITTAASETIAAGSRPAGGAQGYVTIPVSRPRPYPSLETACLRVGGSAKMAIGGEGGPGGTERVNGVRKPGVISLIYERPGKESWWQLLPTLDQRFGFGKASFFGDWTLPVMALLLLTVWFFTVRLLVRELR